MATASSEQVVDCSSPPVIKRCCIKELKNGFRELIIFTMNHNPDKSFRFQLKKALIAFAKKNGNLYFNLTELLTQIYNDLTTSEEAKSDLKDSSSSEIPDSNPIQTGTDSGIGDLNIKYTEALAATDGNLVSEKYLVRTITDMEKKDQVFKDAAENSHKEVPPKLKSAMTSTSPTENAHPKKIDTDSEVPYSEIKNTIVLAATDGNLDGVKYLVGTITDIKVIDLICKDAIEFAAENSHHEVVTLLVQSMSDKKLKDQSCRKAAKTAANNGRLEFSGFLVQMIDDIFQKDQIYNEIAVIAAYADRPDYVCVFIQNISDKIVLYQCSKNVAKAAAERGHSQVIMSLINSTADVNLIKEYCKIVAECAADNDHYEIVNHLLDTVAESSIQYECCILAAESAAKNKKWEIVLDFSQKAKALVNDQSHLRKLITKWAAMNGRFEIIQSELETVADSEAKDECYMIAVESAAALGISDEMMTLVKSITDEKHRDQCCATSAESAARFGYLSTLKLLLDSIVDKDLMVSCCVNLTKASARNGHLDVMKHCLGQISGADIRDQCCMEAAEISSSLGRIRDLKFLIQAISDKNLRDKSCVTVVLSAAAKGQMKVVNSILQAISSDKAFQDKCCRKLADYLLETGKFESAKLEIDVGNKEPFEVKPQWLLSMNNKNLMKYISAQAMAGTLTKSFTQSLSDMEADQISRLLLVSSSPNHFALATVLISHLSPEKVDQLDSLGSTALMLAADAGYHDFILMLLDRGASVHKQDSQGRTALSRACLGGHVRAAKALVDRGADLNHRDHTGTSCVELAKISGQMGIIQLFNPSPGEYPSFTHGESISRYEMSESKLSTELHRLLNKAGFTLQRARCQQMMANWLQGIVRAHTLEDRQMTGSYAEGWANSLVQVNGRTGADSDIDWTVMVAGQLFHLEGGCDGKRKECKTATKLSVLEGHAQVQVGSGSQPAVAVKACGIRPAMDTCYAFRCCSFYGDYPFGKRPASIQLVRATRPNRVNELRMGFSLIEKEIVRKLASVQGQLFVLLKFIFKRMLPNYLQTSGLKTYHAKTIILYMLNKYADTKETVWKPQNLVQLLKECLTFIIDSMRYRHSPDECMMHFFVRDAPLYFRYAGIGGDFDHTKQRILESLSTIKNNVGLLIEQIRNHLRPLESENFYFHPFTLLPLTQPSGVSKITEANEWENQFDMYSDVYSIVYHCLIELQSESGKKDTLMKQLSLLQPLFWCKCAALCMTAMMHLKFGERSEAENVMRELNSHTVQRGWSPSGVENKKYDQQFGQWYWGCPEDSDWAWRFCFPCTNRPHFPFLPTFTQTLFTARFEEPRSEHLYVNFGCLSWSLQAELLNDHKSQSKLTAWLKEVQEDPELEELLTVAHYSDSREQLEMCLVLMERIKAERRVVMETQDEEKIEVVRRKISNFPLHWDDRSDDSNTTGKVNGSHEKRSASSPDGNQGAPDPKRPRIGEEVH